MLQPLRSERRRNLLRGSLLALAGALLLLPLALPLALPAQAGGRIGSAPEPAPTFAEAAEPEVKITRDPFVPEAATQSADATQAVDGGGSIEVEAVASGSSPRALIQVGGTSRIVRVGDALGDSTVNSIGPSGIVLENGETLPFAAPR
jgi:hypothetical protein